jgi:hypothetical protein
MSSACFNLDRASTLAPGSVRGVARFAGAVVPDAVVTISGSGVVDVTNADGAFTHTGLSPGNFALRVLDDDDADGIAERGASAKFSVQRFGEGVGAVDLGPVELQGTVTVRGRVVDETRNYEGVTVAFSRPGVDATAERDVVVDDDGSFSIAGVVPGEINCSPSTARA